MQHHFNTEIAKKYDIVTAILLDHFCYWIEKNRANGKNFYKGSYWTYNTKKAFSEQFPYLSDRQVDYALKKMISDGLIKVDNFNEDPRDRTLWYAITDFGFSILQNCEMYYIHTITDTNANNKEKIYKKESVSATPTLTGKEPSDKDGFTDDDVVRWFENIWELYPKKVDKIQARTTFEHKIRGLSKEQAHKKSVGIYKLLRKHLSLWEEQGIEWQYLKNGSTWLNANIEDSPHFKKSRRK